MIENISSQSTDFGFQYDLNLLNKKEDLFAQTKPAFNTPTEEMEDLFPVNEEALCFMNAYYKALAYLNEGKKDLALALIDKMYHDPHMGDMKDELFPLELCAIMLLYKGEKEKAISLLSSDITTDSTHHRKILLYALGIDKTFHYALSEESLSVDERKLELANKYFWEGNYDLAISLYNEVENESEFYADEITALRADCHLLKGNAHQAWRDYKTLEGFNDPYPYTLACLLSGKTEEVHNLWVEYANFRFDGFFLGFLLDAFEKHPSMFR